MKYSGINMPSCNTWRYILFRWISGNHSWRSI